MGNICPDTTQDLPRVSRSSLSQERRFLDYPTIEVQVQRHWSFFTNSTSETLLNCKTWNCSSHDRNHTHSHYDVRIGCTAIGRKGISLMSTFSPFQKHFPLNSVTTDCLDFTLGVYVKTKR